MKPEYEEKLQQIIEDEDWEATQEASIMRRVAKRFSCEMIKEFASILKKRYSYLSY